MYSTFAKPTFILFLTWTAIGLQTGCDQRGNAAPTTRPADNASAPAKAIAVTVDRVTLIDRVVPVSVSGTLFGDEQATISAKVGGRIESISADVGDRLGPGAALAQIATVDYQIEVDQKRLAVKESLATLGLETLPPDSFDLTTVATVERARFQSENAKARLDRSAQLLKSDPPAISEQEFADLQTTHEVARRDYDMALLDARSRLAQARSRAAEAIAAEQRLADATVRAPSQPADAASDHFAIAARLVSAGEIVSPGTAMFRLVADRPIKFRGAVPERFASQVTPGQPATLQTEGIASVAGTVSRVNPSIDPTSRTFEVEIVTPNTDGRLRPGAFARASITVGRQANVSTVPRDAIVSFAGVDRVFIVKDGKATGTRITIIETNGNRVAIAEPLPAETPIILRGDRGIAEGVAVVIAKPTNEQ